jgi:hypothetical protein
MKTSRVLDFLSRGISQGFIPLDERLLSQSSHISPSIWGRDHEHVLMNHIMWHTV